MLKGLGFGFLFICLSLSSPSEAEAAFSAPKSCRWSLAKLIAHPFQKLIKWYGKSRAPAKNTEVLPAQFATLELPDELMLAHEPSLLESGVSVDGFNFGTLVIRQEEGPAELLIWVQNKKVIEDLHLAEPKDDDLELYEEFQFERPDIERIFKPKFNGLNLSGSLSRFRVEFRDVRAVPEGQIDFSLVVHEYRRTHRTHVFHLSLMNLSADELQLPDRVRLLTQD